ncbi:MAG: hypothetical protein ABI963_12630 [Rhizomicrobium sp.]
MQGLALCRDAGWERTMTMSEKIQEGFDVFTHDGEHQFGAVRQVRAHEIVIYVENAGDFTVPMSAVKDAYSEKVILDSGKLDPTLKDAIRRAHAGEDPRIG